MSAGWLSAAAFDGAPDGADGPRFAGVAALEPVDPEVGPPGFADPGLGAGDPGLATPRPRAASGPAPRASNFFGDEFFGDETESADEPPPGEAFSGEAFSGVVGSAAGSVAGSAVGSVAGCCEATGFAPATAFESVDRV